MIDISGSDLVEWLYVNVEGFFDRRHARKYASLLLKVSNICENVCNNFHPHNLLIAQFYQPHCEQDNILGTMLLRFWNKSPRWPIQWLAVILFEFYAYL